MSDDTTIFTFTGEEERTLDSGLRVVLLKDWREQTSEFFLIVNDSGSYIRAFPKSEYLKKYAEIATNASLDPGDRDDMLEEFGSKCVRVKVDASGRLALPPKMCEAIGVSADEPEVTLKGVVNMFNIWNRGKLAQRESANKARRDTGQPVLTVQRLLGIR